MKNISRMIWLIVLATLFIFSSNVRTIFAQDGKITCESTRGRYNYCRVDTENKVRLVRELSETDCSQGSSWGYDKRGIWVDRGCRAEFEYGKGISATGAAIGAGVVGGVILAAILASRKKNSEKYNDPDSVYNLGFSKGASDAKDNKSSDPGRYRDNYNSSYGSDFVRGYNAGYRNRPSNSGGNTSSAYNTGYQRGIDDSIANRRSNYQRYDDQYDSRTESDFRNGYDDGYRNNRDTSFYRDDENGNVPNWLVGTYRGYSNTTRNSNDLTIYPDGRVWLKATSGTASLSGSYSSNYLYFPQGSYRIERGNNSITVRKTDNPSDTTIYSRIY